jgi:hypothetical protein
MFFGKNARAKTRLLMALLTASFCEGCAMHSTTSSLFEFPFSKALGDRPRIWADVTDVFERNGVVTYQYALNGFPPSGGRDLVKSQFTLNQHELPTEKYRSVSKDKVKCFVQTADGKVVLSYLVTYRDNHYSIVLETSKSP